MKKGPAMNKELLLEKTRHAEDVVCSFIPKGDEHTFRIIDAAAYSVKAGGKRLRPVLMSETYRLFTEKPETDLLHAFMAAIEFIHTYSLIHDDLPAMDDDDLRRGKPTNHVVYGEAFAILAGDALLNLAYETAAQGLSRCTDPDEIKRGIRTLAILSEKAGIFGMVGGQALDVYSEKNEDFTVERKALEFIYENKTSALLEASMMAGAVLAGADEEEIKSIESIASDVGLAFQIEDDILDVTGTAEILGKPAGSDLKNEKATWVTFEGVEGAKKAAYGYTMSAVSKLDELAHKNDFLRDLIIYLCGREK